jgi:hypothetical protein
MDGRKFVFYNESVSPRSLMTDIPSSVTPTMPRHRKWKPKFPPPPPLNLESIEEERGLSEYDCGYLDLGAETPSTSNSRQFPASFHIPARRRSFRRASPVSMNRLSKYDVDRDCGIWYAKCSIFVFLISILNFNVYSFEHAVIPCRTLCCGKIFCTEHLADVRTLSLVHVVFLNPFNSGYMDPKQKDDVLIVKTLAHLQAARFHLHRQLTSLPRKPDAITLLSPRLSILLQFMSNRI